MQRWTKLGRVFVADGRSHWMATHGTYPVALPLDDRIVRIFFSPRDTGNRSWVGYLDMALEPDGFDIVRVSDRPVLDPGPRGAFDDSGVTVGCVLPVDGQLWMYYLGWNVGVTVPFRNFIGLAIGDPETLEFRRYSPAPLIERSREDPFVLGYPWVLKEDNDWTVWYGSHTEWGPEGLQMIHVIKDARSKDGLDWTDRRLALDVSGPPEYALSRPCVLKSDGLYRMWYARRIPGYCIGYAESKDGRTWVRKDEDAGLLPSAEGWDSECVEYPCVFEHAGRHYMLYNGNGYGKSGFGVAVLESWQ